MNRHFTTKPGRRAIAAVGLSAVMLLGFTAVAGARPLGPGPTGDGVATDITATKNGPQVKGNNPGQPVRSQHMFGGGLTRNEFINTFVQTHGYYPAALADDSASSTTVAGLRAENFVQRFGYYPGAAGVAEKTDSSYADAIADARALNGPSTVSHVDHVAQLRAMNEPVSPSAVAGVEASDRADNFPLAQSLAVIAGILVLIAAGFMILMRHQQSPKTV
jgi:hypothetical protein